MEELGSAPAQLARRHARAQLALLGLLLALAVVAWVVTNERMGGMESGPGMSLGGLGFYLTVWVVVNEPVDHGGRR